MQLLLPVALVDFIVLKKYKTSFLSQITKVQMEDYLHEIRVDIVLGTFLKYKFI